MATRNKVPDAGVRELRNNLSRYLDLVRDGEEVTVTDRGRAIARIVPVQGGRLEELVAAGVVIAATKRRASLPAPLITGSTVSDLLSDQRR